MGLQATRICQDQDGVGRDVLKEIGGFRKEVWEIGLHSRERPPVFERLGNLEGNLASLGLLRRAKSAKGRLARVGP
jgi:hypothetical protein